MIPDPEPEPEPTTVTLTVTHDGKPVYLRYVNSTQGIDTSGTSPWDGTLPVTYTVNVGDTVTLYTKSTASGSWSQKYTGTITQNTTVSV